VTRDTIIIIIIIIIRKKRPVTRDTIIIIIIIMKKRPVTRDTIIIIIIIRKKRPVTRDTIIIIIIIRKKRPVTRDTIIIIIIIIIIIKISFSPLLRTFRDFVCFPTSLYLFQSLTCSIVFYLPTPGPHIASFFPSFLISTRQFVSPQYNDRTLAHNAGSTVRSIWLSKNTSFLCQNRTLLFNKSATCVISVTTIHFNLLKPTGYVTHQQFNVQQFYIM